MTKVPSLGYERVRKALQRDGWVVVRQKGSHILNQYVISSANKSLEWDREKPMQFLGPYLSTVF